MTLRTILTGIVFLLMSSLVSGALTDNILSYYHTDTDALDDVSANDLTVDGAVLTTGSTGLIDEAYIFDGTNDDLYRTSINEIKYNADFSISMWINADTLSQNDALFSNTISTNDRFSIAMDNAVTPTVLGARLYGNGGAVDVDVSSAFSSTGAWHHVVFTYATSGSVLTMYLDGVSSTSTTGVFTTLVANEMSVGSNVGSYFFDGKIDEIGVWTRVLTSAEVTELYNSGAGLTYPFVTTSNKFIISSNGLNEFYADLDGTQYSTTNGTINTNVLTNSTILHNLTLGLYNFNLNSSTVYGLNVSNGLYQYNFTSLTINATDSLTGALINNIQTNLSFFPQNFSNYKTNTTGKIVYPTFPNYNYTLNITSSGYNPKGTTLNFTGNYTQTFSLDAHNAVNVNIYNATSLSLITNSVIVLFEGALNSSISNTTTTGSVLFDELTPDTYTVTISSTGYETGTYSVTVGNNTFQNLNAYLAETSGTNVVFTILDYDTGSIIESATFTVETKINGTFTVTDSLLTDVSGRVQTAYTDTGIYRYTVSKTNYNSKTFILDPVIFSSYNVRIQKNVTQEDQSDYSDVVINFNPIKYYNNAQNNFSITFTSPQGAFLIYKYNITYPTAGFTSGQGSNAYGEILTGEVNITNTTASDTVVLRYSYQNSNGELKTFTRSYSITNSYEDHYTFADSESNPFGLPLIDRVIIGTLGIGTIASMAFFVAGFAGAAVISMLGLSYLGVIGFFPLWLTIISSIILFSLASWRSST